MLPTLYTLWPSTTHPRSPQIWPYKLAKFAPLLECIGPGLPHYLGDDCDGLATSLVLIHEYNLKKVIRAGLADMLVEGQRSLDEFWDIELHRRSLERGVLAARHDGELVFIFDIGYYLFYLNFTKFILF